MATSESCRSLCGVIRLTEAQTRLLRERIEQEYHVHLYVECVAYVVVSDHNDVGLWLTRSGWAPDL